MTRARDEWAADFETTTDPDDCRVWAWGCARVGDAEETFSYGNSIEGFLEFVRAHKGRYWFHNLSFDGKFIVDYLLREGYSHVNKKPGKREFALLVSNMGKWYSMEFDGVQFADSLKKITMSVAKMAVTYHLDYTKGEIDYTEQREPGHELTEEELDYLRRDVLIVANALEQRFSLGRKLTTGSDCLALAQDMLGKRWKTIFPSINPIMDAEIRQAYRGGFVYVNPNIKGKVVGEGIRLDVNSLYPWAMYDNPLPIGYPQRGSGKPCPDEEWPLWVADVMFNFKLKPGKLPCIQSRNNAFYGEREYIVESVEPMRLWVCSVDWALIQEMYDVDVISWGGHYLFRAKRGIFKDYIDWGMEGKANAEDSGERQNYKLALNSLYGKFGQKVDVTGKHAVLGEDNIVHYQEWDKETRDPVYIPFAVFITAYARGKTIRTAVEFGERFCYSDTDSIHALGTAIPDDVDVHPTRLGAWKHEATFSRAKFLRCKTYVETVDDVEEYTCAGMPDALKGVMRFEDFEPGFTTNPEKQHDARYLAEDVQRRLPTNVPGGVVLTPHPFSIHK